MEIETKISEKSVPRRAAFRLTAEEREATRGISPRHLREMEKEQVAEKPRENG